MYVGGIDIGSLTAKAVVMDDSYKVLANALVATGANSRKSGEAAFNRALKQAGLHRNDMSYVVSTGYGRKAVTLSDSELTEITCHARAAYHICKSVRTIIDIGGQDSKVISINNEGKPVNFTMNDRCAAGSGRFLEVMAGALEVKLDAMASLSTQSTKKLDISSICTVFAESEVVSAVAAGQDIRDIINGIHQAIARRVAAMVQRVGLVEKVMMTGGVAKNGGVVRALEAELNTTILIPDEPQLMGAIGAALIALERSAAAIRQK